MFVYGIGIQYGKQFFAGLTSPFGLKVNALALSSHLVAIGVCFLAHAIFAVAPAHVAGLFAGALTSTPALQAAIGAAGSNDPALGYSVAYPFGLIAPILCMYFANVWLKPKLAPATGTGLELREKIGQAVPRFVEAMDDDFNTALALGVLFETVRAVNRFLAETRETGAPEVALLAHARQLFGETGGVLGLFGSNPAQWLEGIKTARTGRMDITPAEIEGLIAERAAARTSRDFKRSDEIRDLLLAKGIQLLDSPQGTTWDVK
jgi:hypothetical protein